MASQCGFNKSFCEVELYSTTVELKTRSCFMFFVKLAKDKRYFN